jgi:hypothetical protein
MRVFALAEEAARSIEDADWRASALRKIGQALAEVQQWARAEEVACSIEDASGRASALREIGQALAEAQQWEWFITLLQRVWVSAETRSYAFVVFPLVSPLLGGHPSLNHDLLASFGWVDAFLKS